MKKDYYVKIEERTYIGPFADLDAAVAHAELLAEDNLAVEVVTRADWRGKCDVALIWPQHWLAYSLSVNN